MTFPSGQWDASSWDAAIWARAGLGPRPGGGWGNEWEWWTQKGDQVTGDLISSLVEARWTTDQHLTGDGTFRGDLQPGKLVCRLWDPTLTDPDALGMIWARYVPTGATWCWYIDTWTRSLVAPGDPMGADLVIQAFTWPSQLTTGGGWLQRPVESVTARVSAIVADLQANAAAYAVGEYQALADTQAQKCSAVPPGGPAHLQMLRDAGANGVIWCDGSRPTAGGPGVVRVHYDRWETAILRDLYPSEVVAGPPVDKGRQDMITHALFAATDGGAGDAATSLEYSSNNRQLGTLGPSPLRLWGNVAAAGAEYSAALGTLQNLVNGRSDPYARFVSSMTVISGDRSRASDAAPAPAEWKPAQHDYGPLDVARYVDPNDGQTYLYRVVSSSHQLTPRLWQTIHQLEPYIEAAPMAADVEGLAA